MLRVHEEDHAGRAATMRTAHQQRVPETTRASQLKLLEHPLIPEALDRKYPNAPPDRRRQRVFPQEKRWKNTKTAEQGRHHVGESLVGKAVREALTRGGSEETIRITRRAKWKKQILPFDIPRCVTPGEGFSQASYAGRKKERRILYGYI